MTPGDLRTRRLALHLSQKQLAAVLGVGQSTVAHWEQGVQSIPPYLDLALRCLEQEHAQLMRIERKEQIVDQQLGAQLQFNAQRDAEHGPLPECENLTLDNLDGLVRCQRAMDARTIQIEREAQDADDCG